MVLFWCSDEKNIVVSAASIEGAESKFGLASSDTGAGAAQADCVLGRAECQIRPRNSSRSVVNQIDRPSSDTEGERSMPLELSSTTIDGAPQGSDGLARRETQMSLSPARSEEK